MKYNENYNVLKPCGQGHFSLVQKCERSLDRTVIAIKCLAEDSRTNQDHLHRFASEIEFLQQLSGHRHIVEVLDQDNDDPPLWYAMPFAPHNLEDFIARNNTKLSQEDRLELFDQVIDAIAYAHGKGILHRDICPQNVLVFLPKGRHHVTVADFGLGRDMQATTRYTNSSVDRYGHHYYVAPEQLQSLKYATAQSDIYSLGRLLDFILTGKIPDDVHSVDFAPVIRRCTERDPSKRYESVEELTIHHQRMRSLVFSDAEPTRAQSLALLLERNPSPDWLTFHRTALEANCPNHPYKDFIEPVISFFSRADRIREYERAIGGDLISFVSKFVEKVNGLYGTVGWPFSATDSFGLFLRDVYRSTENHRIKILCLKEIWNIAYPMDQWDVQRAVKGIMGASVMPHEIHAEFADHVLNSGGKFSSDDFAGIGLPPIVMRAMMLRDQQAAKAD
jgi:eukaryotic-like serine/threonine-protein kinase